MKHSHQRNFAYTFDPNACRECAGKCCTGISGNIWVSPEEIKAIARFLNVNQVDLIQESLNNVANRWSIKERYANGQYACIFFDRQRKSCRVYAVRPNQCRTFPFWDYFMDRMEELIKECPGVRRDKKRALPGPTE